MGGQNTSADAVIAALAGRSKGVVRRTDLLREGITERQIERRLARGALLVEHRGVYRVGHRAPSVEASYLAAVWACGARALLSGRASAWLLALLKGAAPAPEVTTPTRRRVEGVRTRHAVSICRREATSWHGIPVTTVPATLVDLAAVLDAGELARACHEAQVRHRTTPAAVEAVLRRRGNARGAAQLRAVLFGDVHVSLSELERRFLALLVHHNLPLPITNRRAGAWWVDCRWPEHRLTVELDSYRFHHTRHAWERDRRRERDARAAGDEFRRFTWGDVTEEPAPMLADLGRLLGAGLK